MAKKRKTKRGRERAESPLKKGTVVPARPSPAEGVVGWLRRPSVLRTLLVFVLLLGAFLRLYGVTERHYTDTDLSSLWETGAALQLGLDRIISGPDSQSFVDVLAEKNLPMRSTRLSGKAGIALVRAAILVLFQEPNQTAGSVIDVVMGVAGMGFLLWVCLRRLGPGITFCAAALWIVGGSQFLSTGRAYNYSGLILASCLTWGLLMNREQAGIYRTTFLAGLFLGLGATYHYMCVLYIPLACLFVLLFPNRDRFKGKVLEYVSFGSGVAVGPLVFASAFWLLLRATGVEWNYGLARQMAGGGQGSAKFGLAYMGNSWFNWTFLNGTGFMVTVLLGFVVVAVYHFRKYGVRWSVCENPMMIPAGVGSFGMLLWGVYFWKVPRVHLCEISVWPVLAAIAVYHIPALALRRVRRPGVVNALRAALVFALMATQWPHTQPMLGMGAGIRETMEAVSGADKTAWGEGRYSIWPANPWPRTSKAGLSPWEYADELIAEEGYDYFFVDYSRILSFIVTYPGAGRHLMLGTYNRLVGVAQPRWRFEYGAPIHARLENGRISWLRQWITPKAWREKNTAPTPYDVLVDNVPYIDVFRSEDVIEAYRESRIDMLAQLLVMSRTDRQRFQQLASMMHPWWQHNMQDAAIMKLARDRADAMLNAAGSPVPGGGQQ